MGRILAGAGAGSVDIRRPPSCFDLTPASPTHSYTHAFCATPLLRVLSAQCASTCCLFSAMCFRAQTNRLLAMCRCTPHGNSTGIPDFRSAPSADHLCSVQQMLTSSAGISLRKRSGIGTGVCSVMPFSACANTSPYTYVGCTAKPGANDSSLLHVV